MNKNSSSNSSARALLKEAAYAIKLGNGAEVVERIEEWGMGKEEPAPQWDVIVGAGLWNRCADREKETSDKEMLALERVYACLTKYFIQESDDKDNYMERIKVLGSTLKFFVLHKRVNLEGIETILQQIAKSSYHVRQKDYANFKTVCVNFYAILWNYMRENQQQFSLLESLKYASLSIRWLVVLGLDQFSNMGNKLAQISFLLVKNQTFPSTIIADSFYNLSHQIVDLIKEIVLDDSRNGLKIKKTKAVLPVSHFYGILNVSFVLTRQLVLFEEFDKALKIFRPITSVAKVYFDTELTEVWKKILDAFVKISMVTSTTGCSNISLQEDLINSSEMFRQCRKQILDMKFQKAYPGYAFCFMYAFTECIGLSISNFKKGNSSQMSVPLLKNLPLTRFAKFLKEILFAADACVGLDNMRSKKYVLEGITEGRKADIESNAMFHVLKFASDRISDKDTEINKDLQQITESCFSTLMTLTNRTEIDNLKSAELCNLLTYHTCNIGFGYQKRKNFKEAMNWCYRSIDAYQAFRGKSVDIELKVNVLNVGLLLADCHRQSEEYLEGLRWLSKWLILAPQLVDSQSTAYDIYEQIPWSDWSVHWQALQKEICSQTPTEIQTVVDFMEAHDPASVADKFASKVLRLEMNAYFSGRQALVPAMLNVGQKLVETGYSIADVVLGLTCQAIGLWWMSTEESLSYAIGALDESIGYLNKFQLSTTSTKGDEALRIYLSGLVIGWRALCIMKLKQNIAETELNAFRTKLCSENPEKFKDRADGTYAVPGFTSLTIEDEMEWAVNLAHAAECFYQLAQMEEVFKSITDFHCPALAQVTIRLIACCLSAVGDKFNSVKAWFSVYVIAKNYDRKGLIVLAASEVLKIIPCTTLECVQYAEKVNQTAKEGNFIKHNKAIYYRLDLAKAMSCYQTKNYDEGFEHLARVYEFLAKKDNFDSTLHLTAEADYVLSLYRSVALNQDLEMPKNLPEMLCKMTPAGLASKAYKLVGSLSRVIDVLPSGWTDLYHNYYLLGSMSVIGNRTLKLLKETGKLRDLKCFITDSVYYLQRLGFISRSVATLIPLIETDIASRHFHVAQIRIAAIAKVLLAGSYRSDDNAPTFSEAKKFLETHLKIPGLTISRLENVSNLKWHLADIDATSFHYKTRSSKYLNNLKKDCEAIDIKSVEMKAPTFLRHPLTCNCYTCSHPDIIPSAVEFLVAQAKYAVAMKWKISMAVLELTRLHHQRAMFRILFNMEYVSEQLQPVVTRKNGYKLLQSIYSQFFFKPGFQIQLANMEICPVQDISHIVALMNAALRAVDIVDSQDYVLKSFALEIGTSALYEYFFASGKIPITDGNVQEIIRSRANEQQEKENTVRSITPDVVEATPPVVPHVVRKRAAQVPLTKQQQHSRKATVTSLRPRRILNNKAQQQEELSANVELIDLTKVENTDDERRLPVIPPPNFDDSNDD